MCRGTLPEIPFSNVKCPFRPKTAFAPTPPNNPLRHLNEEHLEPVDISKLKRQDSNEIISHEIATSKMNYLVEETLTLDQCPAPIRPKTVRVTCSERTSCNPRSLTVPLQNEQNHKTHSKEHKKREIVVFLPTSGNGSNSQTTKAALQGLSSHLPEIGSDARTLSHSSEDSDNHRWKTTFEHDEIPPLPHKLTPLNNVRHSVGLPVISSPRPERKPVRRVKSHDLEHHLKQAEKDYDKYEAKAFLVYNWMKAQSDLSQ